MPFSTIHHHLSQLALDICRGPWLLYNAESQIQLVRNFFAHLPVQDSVADFTPLSYTESGDVAQAEPSSRKECVAVIPIIGTITKYDSCATIGATTVASVLVEAAETRCRRGRSRYRQRRRFLLGHSTIRKSHIVGEIGWEADHRTCRPVCIGSLLDRVDVRRHICG